jgi:hypothetical protein
MQSEDIRKFLAVVLAREDHGLIEPCIKNLLRNGFSAVHVCCVESFGSQVESLLRKFESFPEVSFSAYHPQGDAISALKLSGPFFAPILDAQSPDWLAVLDVDEMFATNLDTIATSPEFGLADQVILARYNYAGRRTEDTNDLMASLARPGDLPIIFEKQNRLKEADSMHGPHWLFHSIGPKAIFRPEKFKFLAPGAHRAMPKKDVRRTSIESKSMCYVHIPFTTLGRFQQKLQNVKQYFSERTTPPKPNEAWHWKRWMECLEAEAAKQEFERELLSEDEFVALETSGTIKRVSDILC